MLKRGTVGGGHCRRRRRRWTLRVLLTFPHGLFGSVRTGGCPAFLGGGGPRGVVAAAASQTPPPPPRRFGTMPPTALASGQQHSAQFSQLFNCNGRIVGTPLPDDNRSIASSRFPPAGANTNRSNKKHSPTLTTTIPVSGPWQFQPRAPWSNTNYYYEQQQQQQHCPPRPRAAAAVLESKDIDRTNKRVDTVSGSSRTTVEEGEDFTSCSWTKLDVYLYPKEIVDSMSAAACATPTTTTKNSSGRDSMIHVELNRNSNELVPVTLQRIVMNLTKKRQKQTRRNTPQPNKSSLLSDPTTAAAPLPQVWRVILDDELDRGATGPRDNDDDDGGATATASEQSIGVPNSPPPSPQLGSLKCGELLNVAAWTNADLWHAARQTPLVLILHLPSPVYDDGNTKNGGVGDDTKLVRGEDDGHESASIITLWMESCIPTLLSVRTFEDFRGRVFAGVPLVVQVESMYSSHCRVDWYMQDVLVHTTTTTALGDFSHCFTPHQSQVDQELTIVISPYRTQDDRTKIATIDDGMALYPHNGSSCQHAYRFQNPVQALPENTVLRIRAPWLARTRADPSTGIDRNDGFRVMSYNILANQNAFQSNQMPFYPYVSKDILSKDRRMPLILHEILTCRPHVICLQEVDESVYQSLLKPVLSSKEFNYEGYYSGKKSEGTREGCALFWSLHKFMPVPSQEQKTFSFKDLVTSISSIDNHSCSATMNELALLLERRPDLHQICTTKLGHVIQMVPLMLRSSTTRKNPIWIANTHLFFHPRASHIRLLQMLLLTRQLGCELHHRPGPAVLCGDFNSSLQNSAGKLILDRTVPSNFRDNKIHLNSFNWEKGPDSNPAEPQNDDFPSVSLPDSFPRFHSAINPTPVFTHLISNFQGSLDYILISDELQCSNSSPMPTVEDVTVDTAMPSANLPSDHVSLVCDLVVNWNGC